MIHEFELLLPSCFYLTIFFLLLVLLLSIAIYLLWYNTLSSGNGLTIIVREEKIENVLM